MADINIADLLLQVFGERALVWIVVVGAVLAAWAQLRAAVPQAWWDRLPRPLLAVLDVLAANWGSARNAQISRQSGAGAVAGRSVDEAPAQRGRT